MSGPYDRDDREEIDERAPADREISLGTGAMLAIFFALVLVCGAFFGFGYSLGHKSPTLTPGVSAEADPLPATTRPAAAGDGTGGGLGVVIAPNPATPAKASAGRVAAKPKEPPAVTVDSDSTADQTAESAAARTPTKPFITVPASAPASTGSVAQPAATPATVPGGTVFVQISAVSHQEDAQSLISALKRRGYNATVRHEAQDQLLHIQLGPYATKKDADAMKLRLSADGYNAILK